MKHQPNMAIESGGGVGHFFPLKSVGCSRRWSQPRGTSLLSEPRPVTRYLRWEKKTLQSVTTSSKCSFPQSMRAMMAGISERPVSVREYSTRGGTSG